MSTMSSRNGFHSATAATIVITLLTLSVASVAAQESASDLPPAGPTRAEQETMAEIDGLRQRIETLLEQLSPEIRAEVRARLEGLSIPKEALPMAMADAAEDTVEEASTMDRESRGVDDARREAVTASGSVPVGTASEATDLAPDQVSHSTPASTSVSADAVAGTDFSYLPPSRSRQNAPPATCNTLAAFDSDRDGSLSALDRYWRHIYLWSDRNGDGEIAEVEVLSAYERGVRSIPVSLQGFVHADLAAGELREIEVDRFIVLDLFGNGFDSSERMGDDGVLVVDATRIARGTGPELRDETGLALAGLQALRSGLRIATDAGDVTVLDCP